MVDTHHLEAWAVVHRDGSYHKWHRHSGVPWKCVGVLYLTTGTAATVLRAADGEVIRSEPIAGRVITFPPDIEHATEPHHDLAPRVTIAFNAR